MYQPKRARLVEFWRALQTFWMKLYISRLTTVAAINVCLSGFSYKLFTAPVVSLLTHNDQTFLKSFQKWRVLERKNLKNTTPLSVVNTAHRCLAFRIQQTPKLCCLCQRVHYCIRRGYAEWCCVSKDNCNCNYNCNCYISKWLQQIPINIHIFW